MFLVPKLDSNQQGCHSPRKPAENKCCRSSSPPRNSKTSWASGVKKQEQEEALLPHDLADYTDAHTDPNQTPTPAPPWHTHMGFPESQL